MRYDVGVLVQHQPKLVGQVLPTTQTIGEQVTLVLLDHQSGVGAVAIDFLLQVLGRAPGKIRDDKAAVRAEPADFYTCDHATLILAPGLGRIIEVVMLA